MHPVLLRGARRWDGYARSVPQVGLHLVGTGPFKLDSLASTQIELSRFDGYWGEKPNVDRIVIRAYPETATLINALVSGEVLLSSTRDFSSVNRLIQSGLDISPIITHRFAYADFQEGFELMKSGNSGKIVLDWAA